MRCDVRVFRTIGTRAPNYSQEVAWLELSGGVRSLPQVPWWNAERRARLARRAPRREARRLLNSVSRRSAFLFRLAADDHDAPGPTTGGV
jgi:hypothetical protein